MPIKNKDGTVFKLRGPNPMMNEQVHWDKDKIVLHNLGWRSEVVTDARNPVREMAENVVNITKELQLVPNDHSRFVRASEFIREVQKAASEPEVTPEEPEFFPEPQESPPEPEPVSLNVDERLARVIRERGVEYYCAPVVDTLTHTDDLYGTTYETPRYGTAFVFDAVVIDRSDLQIQFWCLRHIQNGSVVYQKAKGGEWERRWWRVYQSEPKSGGYLVLGNISDVNPDFSR